MMTTTTTGQKTREEEEEEEEEENNAPPPPPPAPRAPPVGNRLLPKSIIVSAHSDTIKDETTFLSNQDEKIGHLERAISLRRRISCDRSLRTQPGREANNNNNNNMVIIIIINASFTTCSILSLEDSALDVENGDAEAGARGAGSDVRTKTQI